MDAMQTVVVVGGLVLIAANLWYFLGRRETVAARGGAAGVQEVDITVKGGYVPDRIVVQKGRPVRLNFNRQETNPCTDQVVLGDFGIVQDLPPFHTTPVEFTPQEAGEFPFTCGMRMIHGTLVVE